MSDTVNRRQRQPEPEQSLGAYIAQGAGFIAFLLMLFAVAGFRG